LASENLGKETNNGTQKRIGKVVNKLAPKVIANCNMLIVLLINVSKYFL